MKKLSVLVALVLSFLVGAPVMAWAAPVSDLEGAADQWPADKRYLLPGTPEFQKQYKHPLCGPGQNIWPYIFNEMILGAPQVYGLIQSVTGTPALATMATTVTGTRYDQILVPNIIYNPSQIVVNRFSQGLAPGRADFQYGPGLTYGDMSKWEGNPNPGPCARDLAQFGQGSPAENSLGIAFYPTPDEDSLKGYESSPFDDAFWSWVDRADAFHADGGVKIRDPSTWCGIDGLGALCGTAYFLRCPTGPDTSAPATGSRLTVVQHCRMWNQNVMIANAILANALHTFTPADRLIRAHNSNRETVGDLKAAWRALFTKGGQAFVKEGADTYATLGRVLEFVGGAGLIIGAVAIPGPGWVKLLIGIGGVLVATGNTRVVAGVIETAFGAVNCATDIGKCLAKAAAAGITGATGLIISAADQSPPAFSDSTRKLFNSLAAISAIIAVIIALFGIGAALVAGRHGRILLSLMGVVEWVVVIALGGTVLGVIWAGSEQIARAIGSVTDSTQLFAVVGWNVGEAIRSALPALTAVQFLIAAVLFLLGMLAALIVYIQVYLTYAILPLIVGVLILQVAGRGGTESVRKWAHRGFGLFWVAALMKPVLALIVSTGAMQANQPGLQGIVTAVTMLLLAAVAPWLIVGLFPLMSSAGLGIGRAVLAGAGTGFMLGRGAAALKRLGGRVAGAATQPGGSRAQGLATLLSRSRGDAAMAGGAGGVSGARGSVGTFLSGRQPVGAVGAVHPAGEGRGDSVTGGPDRAQPLAPEPGSEPGQVGPAPAAAPASVTSGARIGSGPPGGPGADEGRQRPGLGGTSDERGSVPESPGVGQDPQAPEIAAPVSVPAPTPPLPPERPSPPVASPLLPPVPPLPSVAGPQPGPARVLPGVPGSAGGAAGPPSPPPAEWGETQPGGDLPPSDRKRWRQP